MLLNDVDGLKKEELAILGGTKHITGNEKSNKNPDVWQNFYERLKDIREYHKKH